MAGVCYASVREVSLGFIAFTFLLCAAFFISSKARGIQWVRIDVMRKLYSSAFCVLLALGGFWLGITRYYISEQGSAWHALDRSLGKQVKLEGIISDEPDQRETGVKLTIDVGVTKVITTADFYPVFNYGDKVSISGILTKPEVVDDATSERSFNYPGYLAKDGIFYVIKRPRLYRISEGNGAWIKEKLFNFKRAFLSNIHHAVPEPEASLAGGLVVGAKQSLGKTLEEDFRRAGIIHIVVLSGFNITIVAVAIMKILSFLPEKIGAGFGVLGLILFAILTGGTATVVRSTLMTFLVIAAKLTHRDYDIMRGLSLAGFCMVFENPLILMFDPSFELSFLATFGLILMSPHVKPWLAFFPEKFGFREIAVSTFATQIFVLPYLLYQMGQLSVVGLVVNFLVLPLIPLTMLFIFISGVAGFILKPVSLFAGYISYLFLAYELKIVEFFANLSFASVSIQYFPLWMLILLYIIYAVVLIILKNGRKNKVTSV